MKQIKYRDWEIEVDMESTKKEYEKIEKGAAEICNCEYCDIYIKNREIVFPPEIKNLFKELGIDSKKEAELYYYGKDDKDNFGFNGWFHFIGKFKGKNLIVPTSSKSATLDFTFITEDFKIGFHYDSSSTIFEESENLVQLEFDLKTKRIL